MRPLTLTTISTLAVSMAAALLAAAAFADLTTKAVADELAENIRSDISVSARDTSSLRCWQEGQLLFEQTHLAEKKLSSAQNMMVFKSDARGESREVYLINSGTATCLYEKI